MKRWTWVPPLLAAVWVGCGSGGESQPHINEGEQNPTKQTRIRATFPDGEPVVDALVLLDGAEAGRTDTAGSLALDVSSSGEHQLELKVEQEDGVFSRDVQSIRLTPDGQEVAISLPRPVRMLPPLQVTTSLVHLNWQRSQERGFREYKVYANFTPAFDEKNGTLVFVGTDVDVVDFQLTGINHGGLPIVAARRDLYFRVFVLDKDGSMAGSNILHVRTPNWENEHNFTRFYRLTRERNFAGARPIFGVAFDGTALWFLYREEVGGMYDNDRLKLVRRDPETLQVLKEIAFEDYRLPRGMTWDGASLWVYFDHHGDGRLVNFDPTTGARGEGFVAMGGAESIAWTGSHLLLSMGHLRGQIERVDPVTGGVAGSLSNPFNQAAGSRALGVAYRPGETWVSNMFVPDLVIINDAGDHIGVVNDNSRFAHMTFMGDKLVGVTESSQVYVMKLTE
ncbi:hypothetical protein HPC49_21370 [Pyxidicoccus fallax]|uniref:Lipoprotein n=1 Tax=Pyxidicoccus fallax TaxID=394095 RepID=A0A848LIC9_9BACT|nr:hypothetical protein [Pyxidicoccus fallax]NMO17477.1 hypothetical protein [Pyxidicoccus fallax]NPC80764.1 hypothetical protein [Pyxidicoccus fallax]